MRTLSRSFLLSASALLVACGGAPATAPAAAAPASAPPAPAASSAPPAAAAEARVDSLWAFAREAPPLKIAQATSPDGAVSLSVEASAAPTFEAKGEVMSVSIPIGTEQPIVCMMRGDSPAPSSLLYVVIRDLKRSVKSVLIKQMDTAVAGNIPYIFAEALYKTEQQGQGEGGALKVAAFERGNDTLFCLHDEPGYTATFRRITEGVARSMVNSKMGTPEVPLDLEVSIARLGKQPIGYELVQHFVRPDGTHAVASSSTLLVQRPDGELTSSAGGGLTISDKDGVVTSLRAVSEDDAEAAYDITLERKGAGKYHAEGTQKSKPVKGDFTSKLPLYAAFREHREVHDKMVGGPKVKELTLARYAPDDEPLAMATAVWRATAEPMVFDTTLGKMVVKQTVDADGRPKIGVAQVGGGTITLERAVLETKKGDAKAEPKKDAKKEPKKG